MSLIQAALSKTQKSSPTGPLQNLKEWDRTVENKLSMPPDRVQEKIQARKQEKRMVLLLALLTVAGLFYLIQASGFKWISHKSPVKPAANAFRSEPMPIAIVPIPPRVESQYQLNGVSWDAKEPVAVINQELVKVGDRINKKALVKSITPDGAVLESDGQSLLLKLNR